MVERGPLGGNLGPHAGDDGDGADDDQPRDGGEFEDFTAPVFAERLRDEPDDRTSALVGGESDESEVLTHGRIPSSSSHRRGTMESLIDLGRQSMEAGAFG